MAVVLGSWLVRLAAGQVIDPCFWTTDRQVSVSVLVGDTLYVGGDFGYIGPRTGSLAVFDSVTGVSNTGFPRVDGSVDEIAPDGSGGWYIGGEFSRVDGLVRNRLAHLRADGTLDGWDPNADGTVTALAFDGGLLYVGGIFSHVGGAARAGLAALDATTGQATPWNPGVNARPNAIVPDGAVVWVGGEFTSIGGQARSLLAALDATSGLATTSNPGITGTYASVYSLALGDHVLYAGGYFSGAGGQARANLAAFDAGTGALTDWNPAANGRVMALALRSGAVIAGGYFTTVGGQSRNNLAALDARTGLATSWNPAPNYSVYALSAGGNVIHAAGEFSNVGGQPCTGVAALDPVSGAMVSPGPALGSTSILRVNAICPSAGAVAVGGNITSAGGVERARLAAIDVTTGRVTDWNPGADGFVRALIVLDDAIVAGGSFTTVGGQAHRAVAMIDRITGVAKAWDPGVGGGSPAVEAILPGDGVLVLGGSFTSVGGMPSTNLAMVDPVDGAPAAWNPVANGSVRTLAWQGGRLLAGGFFTSIGGQPRNLLAALDSVTGLATSWNPGINSSGVMLPFVQCLVVRPGVVYVTGRFDGIGAALRGNIAALDPVSGAPLAWNPNANFTVFTVVPSGASVFAVGAFASIGGKSRRAIAELDATTAQASPWKPGETLYPSDFLTNFHMTAGASFAVGSPGVIRILPTPVSAPAVTAIAPSGGEVVHLGDTVAFTWNAVATDPGVQSVDLYLSRSGSSGPWEAMALAARNTSSYSWKVTGPPAPGNCYWRIDARDWFSSTTSVVSAGAFAIADTAGLADIGDTPVTAAIQLLAPAPNPSTSHLNIRFELPREVNVRVSLLDVQGREVARIVDERLGRGRHAAALETSQIRAGLYFLDLATADTRLTRRVIVAH